MHNQPIQISFDPVSLDLIVEALEARIETGDFKLADNEPGEIVICSPSHLKKLQALHKQLSRLLNYQ